MKASSSSPSSGHSSTGMYYKRTLLGHPLFVSSVLHRPDVNGPGPPSTSSAATDSQPDLSDNFVGVHTRSEIQTIAEDGSANTGGNSDHERRSITYQPSFVSSDESINAASPGETFSPASGQNLSTASLQHPQPSSDPRVPHLLNLMQPSNRLSNSTPAMEIQVSENGNAELVASSMSPSRPLSIDRTTFSFLGKIGQISNISSHTYPNRDVFVMKESDLARGNSMTCTVVNLLRGCNLLDSCTLEDLCDYLPALRRKHSSFFLPSQTPPPISSTTPSKQPKLYLPGPSGEEFESGGGSLVDYLLTCSRLGSTSLVDFLPPSAGSAAVRPSALPLDWRRGRSDGMVCLVADSLTLGPLLRATFLPSADPWSSPMVMLQWLRQHLASGAVVVVALPEVMSVTVDPSSSTCSHVRADRGWSNGAGANSCCELTWRHRVVYGVSENGLIHLSNPIDTITAEDLLAELSQETRLCVPKMEMMGRLWRTGQSVTEQDISVLARQEDRRWGQLNILGQLISTFRDYESTVEALSMEQLTSTSTATTSGALLENFVREPHLVIPCCQRPGLSVFVPSHSVHNPTSAKAWQQSTNHPACT